MAPPAVDTPKIVNQTADEYLAALRTLVEACEAYIDETDCDTGTFDLHALYVPLRSYFLTEDFRPRQQQTAAEFYRFALRELVEVCDDYADVCDLDSRFVDRADVSENFVYEVENARRACDRSADEFAPESDANPVKIVPVPIPDRSAPPINAHGVKQGDWIEHDDGDLRQVLTGPDGRGHVRVSDPRDGGALFGGYYFRAEDIGTIYPTCDSPESR